MARSALFAIPALIITGVVGMMLGWRFIVAALLAWALLTWLLGSLRVLVQDARHADTDAAEPQAVNPAERVLFWCEECGTELLLLVRGTARPPSHCGQRMHERSEILDS